MTQAPRDDWRGAVAARPGPRAGLVLGLASCALLLGGGCAASGNPFKRPDPPAAAGEGAVLRGGALVKEAGPVAGTAAAELEAAKALYQRGDYARAEGQFTRIAGNAKNPPAVIEEALYYEGDCQRLQTRYPAAVDTFKKQVKDFPSGAFQQKALRQMFDIANYWLDDTREVMKANNEKREGKRSFVMPVSFVHFDRTKPLFDLEGHALGTMEQVYLNDPTGPLGERALWYIGNVRFYHEDYRDADYYFAQIVKHYPNGEFAPKAIELSILCKQLCPGGPEYDGRKMAEARELVQVAQRAYPELAREKGEFLHQQVQIINLQEAAKDFGTARFYERTKHPGSAYFCYEMVRRRYPGTNYADEAAKRMAVLGERARKDLRSAPKTGQEAAAQGSTGPTVPLAPGAPVPVLSPGAPGLLPALTGPSMPAR